MNRNISVFYRFVLERNNPIKMKDGYIILTGIFCNCCGTKTQKYRIDQSIGGIIFSGETKW